MKRILLNGHPGAGKTTVAEKLRSELQRTAILDADMFRKSVSDYNSSKGDVSLMWQVVHAAIEVYLSRGLNVIVDRCIDNPDDRMALQQIARDNNADFQEIILYTHSLACAVERVKNRPPKPFSRYKKSKIDEGMIASLRDVVLQDAQDAPIFSINTEEVSVDDICKEILRMVKK